MKIISLTVWADLKTEKFDVKAFDKELGVLLMKYGCCHYDGPMVFRNEAERLEAFNNWNALGM
jgi:hypothetical protein